MQMNNSWENGGYWVKIYVHINKPGKVNIKINGVKIQVWVWCDSSTSLCVYTNTELRI